MKFLALSLLLFSCLFGENYSADRSARSFEMKQPRKHRVDTFDFTGDYPELENIDIDARKKKNVEFFLSGNYPQLEVVNYEGAFGLLTAEVTGDFPKLTLINFLCSSCAMHLDLQAQWKQSCEINIRGAVQDIVLMLPKDVGLVIHTKTAIKGKVIPCEGLKKKEKIAIFNKTFENELATSSPIVLTFNIEVTDGRIILNQ